MADYRVNCTIFLVDLINKNDAVSCNLSVNIVSRAVRNNNDQVQN